MTPTQPTAATHAVIVGGGLAGLAAAVALAQRGVAVTVLESRPRLGGRASSFVDKASGTQIDNCQHVSLGCCTNFQHFCGTLGLEDYFRWEDELYFIGRDNVLNRLAAGAFPAPLHFLGSFGKLSYLTFRDLTLIALGMRALARAHSEADQSTIFLDWLRQHRQTPNAIERLWTPVLVSALSETLDRMDVASAQKVFVDAFLANRDGWRVQIPIVPLDLLYGSRLMSWFAAQGATIRLQAGAERIAVENGRAAGVVLRNGEMVGADHVIVAVPHWLVLDLLPESLRRLPELASIEELESAPISSVHLWFDRPVLFPRTRPGNKLSKDSSRTELPHAVLIERFSQWIFNRSVLQSSMSLMPAGHSYQVVISASRNVTELTQSEAIAKVVEELAEIFPESRSATLLHSRLVTEHRAVFSVRPGAARCRPPQQSPILNLQLAGDWTRTGWPATMEGAVRSGYLAAQNVLKQLQRAEPVLQPDLPCSKLSRFMLGIEG